MRTGANPPGWAANVIAGCAVTSATAPTNARERFTMSKYFLSHSRHSQAGEDSLNRAFGYLIVHTLFITLRQGRRTNSYFRSIEVLDEVKQLCESPELGGDCGIRGEWM